MSAVVAAGAFFFFSFIVWNTRTNETPNHKNINSTIPSPSHIPCPPDFGQLCTGTYCYIRCVYWLVAIRAAHVVLRGARCTCTRACGAEIEGEGGGGRGGGAGRGGRSFHYSTLGGDDRSGLRPWVLWSLWVLRPHASSAGAVEDTSIYVVRTDYRYPLQAAGSNIGRAGGRSRRDIRNTRVRGTVSSAEQSRPTPPAHHQWLAAGRVVISHALRPDMRLPLCSPPQDYGAACVV